MNDTQDVEIRNAKRRNYANSLSDFFYKNSVKSMMILSKKVDFTNYFFVRENSRFQLWKNEKYILTKINYLVNYFVNAVDFTNFLSKKC